ncbi:MAG TPA: [FeFe] hydrogenase H-cluster radical SAM maturase HydE [Deltaproteobacteria bacterium]|nr:[FeFe] hydrogenase H-cluster radical SAM maturase HydE [Deltaproteobacteria bacterium]
MDCAAEEIAHKLGLPRTPARDDIITLLEARDTEELFFAADRVRESCVGNAVHLRGIVEFSNHCLRNCLYCGLRRDNKALERYRMTGDEIVAAAREGAKAGIKTIVLQSGEDRYFTAQALAEIVIRLKSELDVAVTVSVGDRTKKDYKTLRQAGADRYLLKHETADSELFARLRPGTLLEDRKKRLGWLKELGFQVGSGNMVGLPGQSTATIADDILLLKELDVEMAGIGPFIPHHGTPLAGYGEGDVALTLKTLAVTRLLLPHANLPATTALATLHPEGRQLALRCGANVVMPDITPVRYKKLYEIYPNKICVDEDGPAQSVRNISGIIHQMGRSIAVDYGHGKRSRAQRSP